MDPQACLQRVFDAMQERDQDELDSALHDLSHWLEAGGFAPRLTPEMMGTTVVRTVRGDKIVPRKMIVGTVDAIVCVDPDDLSKGYKLVSYDDNDNFVSEFYFAK